MEKGIGQSRGVNYEEYDRSLNKKLKVEKEREQEYQKAKRLSTEAVSGNLR
ncbi:hypothetical protein J18TS1_22730 [Oceanobacillus oncorhynchi subsp. incaldanensis]|uniref:YfhE-like protein n=1 Tax=Oceanobacillus aidingensis TaxID=645964 RepID=A0ABV9JZZ9_9BACI|nr:hypothetical protein [Oceanobacillus oncorhynchi]MDM8098577.1 hypothetical protein [Oceanobacillus oncorhynchi]UUI39033.1 hypothetical protein NP440_17100 [Oceanobacillus oncorhynchi]GIO19173.1 hypothetical protein J18TS1_22730 [Oceanobacillus oncorhynchi subsp. incaldanensis]